MFLHVEGLDLPDDLYMHIKFNNPDGEIFRRPNYLIPLGQADWPTQVKGKIVNLYKEIGVPDPLKQKLVEPFATAFGGIKDGSGEYTIEKVNWDFVLDYFTWEAADISLDEKKAKALQKIAKKKWGFMFYHKPVYKDPSDPFY